MSIQIPRLLVEWFVAGFGFAAGSAVCGALLGALAGLSRKKPAGS